MNSDIIINSIIDSSNIDKLLINNIETKKMNFKNSSNSLRKSSPKVEELNNELRCFPDMQKLSSLEDDKTFSFDDYENQIRDLYIDTKQDKYLSSNNTNENNIIDDSLEIDEEKKEERVKCFKNKKLSKTISYIDNTSLKDENYNYYLHCSKCLLILCGESKINYNLSF